jgi:hypothetical protein
MQPEKYRELGGLGAFTIGNDEWIQKRGAVDKRSEYARKVQFGVNRSQEFVNN